jgi:membrane dipeptidase
MLCLKRDKCGLRFWAKNGIRFIVFLSWALLSVDDLLAQTLLLTGSVKDSYSGLPIDSALVEVIAKQTGRRDQVYTDANGEWRISLATAVRDNPANIPSGFQVLPNAPNPFHPPTQLRFVTSRAGRVEIAIYNLLGQQLDAINADLKSAGEYAVSWGGKGGRGILFYVITLDGERFTGKMIQLAGGNVGLGNSIRQSPSSSLSKSAQQEYTFIVSKFFYEPDTLVQHLSGDARIDFILETVHRRAVFIDLHNDVLEKTVETGYQLGMRHTFNHSDIPRFRDGGVDIQLLSIWVSPSKYLTNRYQQALKFVAALDSQIVRNPNDLMQVRQASELEQALAQKKIIGVLAVEGGYAIENSLVKLKDFYARGARYMTITWNSSALYGPDWAVSANDSRSTTVGLNDFGKQVIQTMDSLGMIIDVSHTGIKTVEDILAVTKNPIVATHSGARALVNHTRNLYDDQIRRIAATGGVIGVPFYPYFLTGTSRASVNDIVRHIDYIVKLVGVDYVAIGSDFDGIEVAPTDLQDVSKMPLLTEALLQKGYSRADMRKILGESFLRVFRQVCK